MSPEQRILQQRISDLEHSRTELEHSKQALTNDIRRIVSVLEVLAGYLGIPLPLDVPAAAPAEPAYLPLRAIAGGKR
jgi:hypothetical protein